MRLLLPLLALAPAAAALGQSTITEVAFPGATETRILGMVSSPHVAIGTFILPGSATTHAFIRYASGELQELQGGGADTSAIPLSIVESGTTNEFYTVGGSITGPGPTDAAAVMWFPPSADGATYITDARGPTPHRAGAAVTAVSFGVSSGYGIYSPQGPSFLIQGASVSADIGTEGSFAVTAAYPLVIGNLLNPPGFPAGATVAARLNHAAPGGVTIIGPQGHESRAWSVSTDDDVIAGTIDDQAAIWAFDQLPQVIPDTAGTTGRVSIAPGGYVVGEGSDFLYHRGVTHRLIDLAPPNSGWTSLSPTAIGAGQVVAGYGTHNGEVRGFVMQTCFVDANNSIIDWTSCTPFDIVMSASAAGPGPFTYQWRKDGQPLSDEPNHIAGSRAQTLQIVHSALTDAGSYDCVISNNCDTDVGGTWNLTMVPGPCCYCPIDFNNDGDVGTDADIESFFACLAGSCCDSCCTADVNQDGDIGTDSDIQDFFRLLGGEGCNP